MQRVSTLNANTEQLFDSYKIVGFGKEIAFLSFNLFDWWQNAQHSTSNIFLSPNEERRRRNKRIYGAKEKLYIYLWWRQNIESDNTHYAERWLMTVSTTKSSTWKGSRKKKNREKFMKLFTRCWTLFQMLWAFEYSIAPSWSFGITL